MASTYLDLTNELLRRLLEGQLTASTFASARATQATAKDCIRAAVNEIYAREKEWPFNYVAGSQLLTVGTEEYALPADCDNVDWESFRIQKDDTLNVKTIPLHLISRDMWYKRYRPVDEDSGTDGVSVPSYVFDSVYGATRAFGVTPSPNEAYTVAFDYFKDPAQLSLWDDTVTIPVRYNYVILNHALVHFYMFKDNVDQARVWTETAKESLSVMRHALIAKKDDIKDTRTNYGGNLWRSTLGGNNG